MLRDLLNLKNAVQIRRLSVTNDGMGGQTTSTTLTTITRSNIWQSSTNDPLVSDKITQRSTHILALMHGEYTFTDDDKEVIYNSNTFEITGHVDNIAERNELDIVGLKWLS